MRDRRATEKVYSLSVLEEVYLAHHQRSRYHCSLRLAWTLACAVAPCQASENRLPGSARLGMESRRHDESLLLRLPTLQQRTRSLDANRQFVLLQPPADSGDCTQEMCRSTPQQGGAIIVRWTPARQISGSTPRHHAPNWAIQCRCLCRHVQPGIRQWQFHPGNWSDMQAILTTNGHIHLPRRMPVARTPPHCSAAPRTGAPHPTRP